MLSLWCASLNLRTVETYQTNVMVTLNLLEALRPLEKISITILIASDKCHDNVDWIWGYRETDTLGAKTPTVLPRERRNW